MNLLKRNVNELFVLRKQQAGLMDTTGFQVQSPVRRQLQRRGRKRRPNYITDIVTDCFNWLMERTCYLLFLKENLYELLFYLIIPNKASCMLLCFVVRIFSVTSSSVWVKNLTKKMIIQLEMWFENKIEGSFCINSATQSIQIMNRVCLSISVALCEF